MVTIDALVLWTQKIKETLDRATFEIDGKEVEKEFFKLEAAGNKITILIYLTGQDIGTIENLKVISREGVALLEKPDIIHKDNTEGYITGFILQVTGKQVK